MSGTCQDAGGGARPATAAGVGRSGRGEGHDADRRAGRTTGAVATARDGGVRARVAEPRAAGIRGSEARPSRERALTTHAPLYPIPLSPPTEHRSTSRPSLRTSTSPTSHGRAETDRGPRPAASRTSSSTGSGSSSRSGIPPGRRTTTDSDPCRTRTRTSSSSASPSTRPIRSTTSRQVLPRLPARAQSACRSPPPRGRSPPRHWRTRLCERLLTRNVAGSAGEVDLGGAALLQRAPDPARWVQEGSAERREDGRRVAEDEPATGDEAGGVLSGSGRACRRER